MKNRKLILYLDTSVIGGYYDIEFEKDTKLYNYPTIDIRTPKELNNYED